MVIDVQIKGIWQIYSFQLLKMLALRFVMPLLSGLGPRWFGWVWSHLLPLILSEVYPLFSPNTHAFKQRRWHTIPTTLFETIWNGSVRITFHLQKHPGASFSVPFSHPLLHPTTACVRSHGKDNHFGSFGRSWNQNNLKGFIFVKAFAHCAFITLK